LHARALPLLVALLDNFDTAAGCERVVEPAAYCGFPAPAQLRQISRRGRRAASWSDVMRALRTPV
jgi:hypothetical protein